MVTDQHPGTEKAADADLPRYASYPSVLHFGPNIGTAQARRWAAKLKPGDDLAVQVHVPFCPQICRFCTCRTQAMTSVDVLADYVAAVRTEAVAMAAALPSGVRVSRVHWNGGSPAALPPAEIAALHAALDGPLRPQPGAELSVELGPEPLDRDRLRALAAAGLSEARIGLQDFDPAVQAAIGRTQTVEALADTMSGLRDAGASRLTVEVLYGLPRQTRRSFAATLECLVLLGPDRIRLAPYVHVPRMAKRQRLIAEVLLPDPAERKAQFVVGAALLAAEGFRPVGVDQFVRAGDALERAAAVGRLHRDLTGYTAAPVAAVFGFGAASISGFAQGFVQNAASTGAYLERVRERVGTGVRGVALGLEDRVRGRAIEMLLCDRALDFARLRAEFGDFARVLDGSVAQAVRMYGSLVERSPDRLALRGEDRLLAHEVVRLIDTRAVPVP